MHLLYAEIEVTKWNRFVRDVKYLTEEHNLKNISTENEWTSTRFHTKNAEAMFFCVTSVSVRLSNFGSSVTLNRPTDHETRNWPSILGSLNKHFMKSTKCPTTQNARLIWLNLTPSLCNYFTILPFQNDLFILKNLVWCVNVCITSNVLQYKW